MITTTDRIPRRTGRDGAVRYAVVGLGWIAQIAVLPAFANAMRNSQLAALVSSDATKRKQLGRKYKVTHLYSYDDYEACLRSGEIDAVYIALPNDQHRDYAVRAAEAGVHVLCEKPLAVTERECLDMIEAARANAVKLMTAYRLHFEPANMQAVELVRSGRLGDVRLFQSVFAMKIKDEENIRLKPERGGGTVFDIGIYCINAARYIFQDEPTEVFAYSAPGRPGRPGKPGKPATFGNSGNSGSAEAAADARRAGIIGGMNGGVDEMTTCILRFPGDRHAAFTSSFGVSDVSSYRIVGTEGDLCVEPAYQFQGTLHLEVTLNGKPSRHRFREHDQFAPLLMHFSDCILTGNDPEPSGEEGLADVRIINALYESAQQSRPIALDEYAEELSIVPRRRPSPGQTMQISKPRRPRLVHARGPSE